MMHFAGRNTLFTRFHLLDVASRDFPKMRMAKPYLEFLALCCKNDPQTIEIHRRYLVGLFQPHGNFSVFCLAELFRSPKTLDHSLSLPPELVLQAPVQNLR